jgi:hypothetical protein
VRDLISFVVRSITAVKILARDGRIPRSLRGLVAVGLLPVPGLLACGPGGPTGFRTRSLRQRVGQPALDVHILGNTIEDNAGPGILLELEPNDGPAVIATALEISGNTIVRNSTGSTPPKRGGIVLAGGQDGDQGTLVLKNNVIRGNGGLGILTSRLKLIVESSGNDIGGNQMP